jgi:nondiscriminating aspartyl-tRNA synthetase
MERIWTSELGQHVGQRVRLAGWLHHQRQLAQVTFLLLRDRAGIAQLVVSSGTIVARSAHSFPKP